MHTVISIQNRPPRSGRICMVGVFWVCPAEFSKVLNPYSTLYVTMKWHECEHFLAEQQVADELGLFDINKLLCEGLGFSRDPYSNCED